MPFTLEAPAPTNARRAAQHAAQAIADAALAAADASSATVGDLTWWDFTPGFTASATAVRQAWSAAGLDPDADLPAVPDAATAVSRSVRRAQRQATKHSCRLEDCTPGYDGSRWVAIMQVTPGQADVRGTTVGLVRITPAGVATVEDADPHGIAASVVGGAASFDAVYTLADILDAAKAVLDRYRAQPCRQAPPHIVYWMPAPGGAALRSLKAAIAGMGAGKLS